MKLLLDTHTFIWWVQSPDSMSANARAVCADPANELFLSIVSIWELQIKAQLGKLMLGRPLPLTVADELRSNRVRLLPIEPNDIYALDKLPFAIVIPSIAYWRPKR